MAKGRVSGGTPLSIKANLDINQAKKNALDLIKTLNDIKTAASSSGMNPTTGVAKIYDVKPLNEYQAGLLKIKQEALDLAKQNSEKAAERRAQLDAEKKAAQEKAAAEKSASLATQAALKEETRIKREQIALQKEQATLARKTGAFPAGFADRQFQTLPILTPAPTANARLLKSLTEDYQKGAISLRDYAEATQRVRASMEGKDQVAKNDINSTKESTNVTKMTAAAKRDLALENAKLKKSEQEAAAALKNSAREQMNVKGSVEQRKAAMVRLIATYDRMNAAERNSASGLRLNTIIKDLNAQITKIDPTKVEKVAAQLKKVPESLPAPTDGGLFSRLFSSIGAGALSILGPLAAVGTVWTAVKNIFTHNVEISDTFADVRRTAKLSNDEVDTLAKGLKGLNTRTNLDGLLDVGFIGGRLGAAKKDLPEFIKQVDELAVVLKKELPGGAEAVSEALGSIVSDTASAPPEGVSLGTALSKVGSNLLELAHSGPVTVKYLQDFTLGVAGTAASAKLSIPVISAYGAVLGETKQIASSAALSITRLVTGLTTKTGKYAAIAQLADSTLTVEKFTKLVNTDTKVALDLFFKGLKAGNPVATEYAARLGSVGINTGKVTNAVKILAENQDKLADRIAKGTVAFEEGTSVAHNFEIANDTIGASVDKLGNSIVNLTTDPNSNMTNFFKGVIDGAAKGVSGLSIFIDTVKGLSTDPIKFVGDSAKKSRDESLGKLNEEARRYAQYSFRDKDTDAERLNILKEEVKIRDIINLQYLKAKVAYYNIRPQDRSLADTNQFNDVETKLQKQIALVRELNKIRNKKSVDITGTEELADLDKDVRTIDVIKADIKDLELANKKLDVQSEVFKSNVRQIVKLRKELKLALGGKDTEGLRDENQQEARIKARNSFQKEIDKMIAGSSRTQMNADEAEVNSISEKYDNLRQKAKEYYEGLAREAKKGKLSPKDSSELNVRMSGIDSAELNEKQAAINKGINERFKSQLANQTKDFEEFENYKLKYGLDAAQKRYKTEYTTAEAYAQKLEDVQTNILNKYGDPTGYTEAQRQELEIATNELIAFNERRKGIQDENYARAFEAALTNAQKIEQINREYELNRIALGKDATTEQLANLQRERDERIRIQNEANASQLSGYEDLMRSYDSLTREQLIKALNAIKIKARAEYTLGKLTAEQLAKINGEADNNLNNINDGNPFAKVTQALKDYKAVLNDPAMGKGSEGANKAFKVLTDAAEAAAEYVGKAIESIESDLNNAGLVSDGLQSVIDKAKKAITSVKGVMSGASQIFEGINSKNPVAVVTGAIKLLTSAISLFGTKDKNLQKKIDGYKAQLDSLGNSYKQLERQVANSVGESVYSDQAKEIENLQKQQQLLIQSRDAEGQKKKKDQGKIDEYNNQINDIPNKIDDINNAISQNLIQGTFKDLSNSLADAFAEAFKAGENGIEKMDDVFKNFIGNAIKNSLKLKILDPVVKNFTDDLTQYAKDNNNSIVGFDFDKWKAQLKEAGDQFNAGLKVSEQFFKPDSEKPSSVGTIRAELTEQTGGKLEGLWRGQFDMTKTLVGLSTDRNALLIPMAKSLGDIHQVALEQLRTQMRIDANTLRTADNTDDLGKKLDQIISNTKGGPTARGSGYQSI